MWTERHSLILINLKRRLRNKEGWCLSGGGPVNGQLQAKHFSSDYLGCPGALPVSCLVGYTLSSKFGSILSKEGSKLIWWGWDIHVRNIQFSVTINYLSQKSSLHMIQMSNSGKTQLIIPSVLISNSEWMFLDSSVDYSCIGTTVRFWSLLATWSTPALLSSSQET